MFYADRFDPVVEVCEETGVRVKYPKLVSKVKEFGQFLTQL